MEERGSQGEMFSRPLGIFSQRNIKNKHRYYQRSVGSDFDSAGKKFNSITGWEGLSYKLVLEAI